MLTSVTEAQVVCLLTFATKCIVQKLNEKAQRRRIKFAEIKPENGPLIAVAVQQRKAKQGNRRSASSTAAASSLTVYL